MSKEEKLKINKKENLKNENIKEVTEIKIDIQSQNSNSTKESFLYIFKPKSVEVEFLFGYSLLNSIKFISIILICLGLINVLFTYINTNFFNFLEFFIYSVFYLVSGIYLYVSTVTLKYYDAVVGFKLYESLFIFELTLFILNIILIALGIIHPLGEGANFLKKFSFYLILGSCGEIIKFYLLWIVFSYFVHLKLNRINVILLSK
jgi:hypothetical protein